MLRRAPAICSVYSSIDQSFVQKARRHICEFGSVVSIGRLAPIGFAPRKFRDKARKFDRVHRFGKVGIETSCQSLVNIGGIAISGDGNSWSLSAFGGLTIAYSADEAEPIFPGHRNIAQSQIRFESAKGRQTGL